MHARPILIAVLLAAGARAAEPTTRPASVTELAAAEMPTPLAAAAMLDHGVAVRVAALPTTRPETASATFVVTDAAGHVTARAEIADVTVRGVAPAGPGRVLLWGDRPGRAAGRISRVPYLATWDVVAAKELTHFDDSADQFIQAAAVAPVASPASTQPTGRVLTARVDQPLTLWDAATGRPVRSIDTGHNVSAVALSAAGRRAVLGGGGGDEGVYVWDVEVNRELARGVGHHGPVTSVSFSPDEKYLLSSSLDGSTRVWDAATGRELRRLRPAGLPVARAVFSPDGRRVLTTLAEKPTSDNPYAIVRPAGELRLWDVATGSVLMRYDAADAAVADANFDDGGRTVFAVAGRLRMTWPAPMAAASPTTGPATTATSQSFDLATPLIPPTATNVATGLGDEAAMRVGFLPGGLAYAVGEKNRVVVWDAAAGVRRAVRVPAELLQWPDVVSISGDGRYAVSMQNSGSNEAFVWELASGLVTAHPTPADTIVVNTALSPDGTLVALAQSIGMGEGRTVVFYRTNDATVAGHIDPQGGDVNTIAFTPDGNRLAMAGADARTAVVEFDLDTGQRVATYAGAPNDVPEAIAYSADGKRLLGRGQRGVSVWETATGRRLQRLSFQMPPTAAALSADGHRLLTGGADTNVRLFDVDTGKSLARFDEPTRPVRSLAFSPDGTFALCGTGEPRLWVFRLPAK